ncbi:MAG TPA: PIG-L family deacetylase, partial [Vicinamibacterales bacterium]|nr:PIG-L family deacetylase [Vicinamibacterales bacterium]
MRRYLLFVCLFTLAVYARTPVDAQVRPIYDSGAAGLAHLLGRLQTTASVLHTGAHPDDEDSAFIARTARGDHARVAYLSLTRGEGGQNIIGPELFDALGVIRTEELLQARRLDGGEQFFTRAFDYGFSKTLVEAKSKGNEREVLGDMVRVIRSFRPLVIHSRFAGNDNDGHGQHQFAGYLTPLAFKAAADPAQYPEQIAAGLRPWQARKLYRAGGRGANNEVTTEVQTGVLDAVIGRTYAAIAAEGRSQHKSQEMGGIEPLGPSASGLHLIESRVPAVAKETSVFDGLDTSLPGLAGLMGLPAGTLTRELNAIETVAHEALGSFNALEPERSVAVLARGLTATRAARQALSSTTAPAEARADVDFVLARKETDFSEALAQAAGIVVDPLSDEETIVPGGAVDISVRTFLERTGLATLKNVALNAPPGWRVEPGQVAPPSGGGGGGFRRETPTAATIYHVTAAADARFTEPYFLLKPRNGSLYDWPADAPQGLPFAGPLLSA